jgi:hypothetical protein
MDLTPLDRRGATEGSADCLGQRLGAIDDEQPRHRRVEPALDQVVDERLDCRGVLRRTLDEAESSICRGQYAVCVHNGQVLFYRWPLGSSVN